MEKKQYETLLKELRNIRKLLTADLYARNVSSENLTKITGMHRGTEGCKDHDIEKISRPPEQDGIRKTHGN